MKASEIRIGNWVNFYDDGSTKIETALQIHLDHNHYEPIPLTEEWLFKFGFEWYHPLEHYRLVVNDVWFSIQYDNELPFFQFVNLGYDESMISCPILIEYVHQLQNLYHALCGHELKTKQDDK